MTLFRFLGTWMEAFGPGHTQHRPCGDHFADVLGLPDRKADIESHLRSLLDKAYDKGKHDALRACDYTHAVYFNLYNGWTFGKQNSDNGILLFHTESAAHDWIMAQLVGHNEMEVTKDDEGRTRYRYPRNPKRTFATKEDAIAQWQFDALNLMDFLHVYSICQDDSTD